MCYRRPRSVRVKFNNIYYVVVKCSKTIEHCVSHEEFLYYKCMLKVFYIGLEF